MRIPQLFSFIAGFLVTLSERFKQSGMFFIKKLRKVFPLGQYSGFINHDKFFYFGIAFR